MSVTPSGPEKVSVYEWLKMQCLYVGPACGYLVTIPGTGLQDVSTELSKESVRLLLCCFLVTFPGESAFLRSNTDDRGLGVGVFAST